MKIFTIIFFLLSQGIAAQVLYTYSDDRFMYQLSRDTTVSADKVNYFCPVSAIFIYEKPGSRLLQKIIPPENWPYCDIGLKELFIVEDMNFDRHMDIRLFRFLPAAPNIPYYYWLYNPKTKRFEFSKDLEQVTSPEFDSTRKIVTSQWRSGWGHYGFSTYTFVAGKLLLVEESESFPDSADESKTIRILRKRINGKMKLVKREANDR